MPNTSRLLLPYPVGTDTADVPRDVKALADRIEALTAWIRDVDMAPGVGPQSGDLRFTAIPVATPTAIPGWLLCDGASYLRTGTYASLFGAISTTYGSADGTHFNVPDFRGRSPMGVGFGDAQGAANHALAQKLGLESAYLAANQIPQAVGNNGYEKTEQTTGTAAAGGGQAVLVGTSQVVKTTVAGFSQTQETYRVHPSLVVNVLIRI